MVRAKKAATLNTINETSTTWIVPLSARPNSIDRVTNARMWVALDRLGLVDGQTYPIHMFSANRTGDVKFHLVTNLVIGNTPPLTISATFD